jgi:hypothetical protein
MRDLGWHRVKHHFSLLSLAPIPFDANTFSCYGGSYFVTIAVFSLIFRRPLNLVGPSMPASSPILSTAIIAYYSEYVPLKNCLLPFHRPRGRCSCLHQHFSYLFSKLHNTSMGHARLVCTQFSIFAHLIEGRVLSVPFFLQRIALNDPTIFSLLQQHSQ